MPKLCLCVTSDDLVFLGLFEEEFVLVWCALVADSNLLRFDLAGYSGIGQLVTNQEHVLV
jgi:hypothetical protein